MRTLNECQAEVFRRSEQKIKERKQRQKHILLACIPFVVCITLLSAFFLPENLSKAPEASPGVADGAAGSLTGEKHESMSISISKITVSGLGYDKTYDDISDVQLISNQLFSYSTRGNEIYGEGNNEVAEEGGNDNFGNITDSADTGYTITLLMCSDKKTEYYLTGNTLKNLTADQTYPLSEKQVNELKQLLGVPLA